MVEIYDTQSNLLFPSENDNLTPIDFIPKMSSVACVLQCGGIWIGGKGWGVIWKLNQCVVKPREVVSVFGKCQIQLSTDEIKALDSQDIKEDVDEDEPAAPPAPKKVIDVQVEDSDEEPEEEVVAEPAAVVAAPVEPPKKKIIKKKM
jgi:hypothetical protein